MSKNHLHLKPLQAKLLVCALGLLVFVIDMAVSADLDIAIFYCFVIVLCSWSGSLAFLWTAAAVFAAATLPGLLVSPSPVTPLSWVDWANRIFGMGALLLLAVFIHLRMQNFQLLEDTINAKNKAEKEFRESEARLRLARVAGRIGSWEWTPIQDADAARPHSRPRHGARRFSPGIPVAV